jgi:GNAT superfamily N-acetyltransferase
MNQPVSMLIHTSQSVNKHFIVAEMVKDIISQFKGPGGLEYIKHVYQQQVSMLNEKRFREEVKNFPKRVKIKDYPSFDLLAPYIKELIRLQTTHIELNEEESKLEYNRGIHLCIDNCVNNSPYLEGYIFENAGKIQGYAMVAKSFSTEFGRPCIWIEDLYIKEEFRNQGLGSGFFKFIEEKYSGAIFRLEAEEENKIAIKVYKKAGFDVLPYIELIKL